MSGTPDPAGFPGYVASPLEKLGVPDREGTLLAVAAASVGKAPLPALSTIDPLFLGISSEPRRAAGLFAVEGAFPCKA